MYLIETEDPEFWYHGSAKKITKWEIKNTGKGIDQEGAGLYFTTDIEDAQIHGDNIHQVKLNFKKLLSGKIKPKPAEISKLMKQSPYYKEVLEDWGQNEKEAFNYALENYIDNDTHLDCVHAVEADFYRKDGESFCKAMLNLGYDGFIVDIKYNNILRAIVWNPKIIENV